LAHRRAISSGSKHAAKASSEIILTEENQSLRHAPHTLKTLKYF